MPDTAKIIPLTTPAHCRTLCDSILAHLPDWFGPADIYGDYLDDVETRPVFCVEVGREQVGIMALTHTADRSIDIHLIALHPDHHGRGYGRMLVDTALAYAQDNGAKFLTVKTLGPSRPHAAYAKTLKFYHGTGFSQLEEFMDFWGDGYPMLLLCRCVP